MKELCQCCLNSIIGQNAKMIRAGDYCVWVDTIFNNKIEIQSPLIGEGEIGENEEWKIWTKCELKEYIDEFDHRSKSERYHLAQAIFDTWFKNV